jgi:hypothetical protein
MRQGRSAFVWALVGGLTAGGALAQTPSTGPVAVYWVSAATTNGMAGMPGMGGAGMGGGQSYGSGAPQQQQQPQRRPGLGAMMGGALGGGPLGAFGGFGGRRDPPPQAQDRDSARDAAMARMGMGGGGGASKTLTLQLGSTQGPSGPPEAAHFVPAALGAGPSLPLVTPQTQPREPEGEGGPPQMTQRPRGRMLIYWGCGEHAQGPITIDFAKIGPGQPMPNMPVIAASPGRPPGPGRYATYGQWPNEQARTTVPANGSLVGDHTIKGNYSPDIHFALAANQDFLDPLQIVSRDPTPAGGTRVAWQGVPGATGYYAWLFGAEDRGATVVVWSSGNAANMMGALTDYLPPGEVRRLVAQGVVMSPETTSCVVPSEVIKASPFGMLQMIAYGEESDFADPPRPRAAGAPWHLRWTVKVRRKSTTSAMLGMPGGRGGYGG